METYMITKGSRIFLYGAGSLGSIVGKYLLEAGFQISGYIDQRAEEIHTLLNGIPCYSKTQAKDRIDKNDIIIITVKDVFEHETIKEGWYREGFSKIIYKPISMIDGEGNDCEAQISAAYDLVVGKQFLGTLEVPFAEERHNTKTIRFLLEGDDWCVACIPSELIYTNKKRTETSFWGDINIHALFPHLSLFRFFSGDMAVGCGSYLAFCEEHAKQDHVEITQSWRRNVLRNRYNVYMQMRQYLAIDSGFFIRNAPEAEWNEKGYFNLMGGKHRSAFLASQNFPYIPCKISKADFQRWRTSTEAGEKSLPESPFSVGVRNPESEFWKEILRAALFHIYKRTMDHRQVPRYRGKSFLNLTQNDGYLTRNLIRFGLRPCGNKEVPEFTFLDVRNNECPTQRLQFQRGTLFCIEDGEIPEKDNGIKTVIWRGVYLGQLVRFVIFEEDTIHGIDAEEEA